MRAFVAMGTKFSAHGHTWIADGERTLNPQTAVSEKIQIWRSKKTWLTIICRYDIRKQELKWAVGRYSTSQTRSGAAALAAAETRENLDNFVDYLAKYGDEIEKRNARMILKKKGHLNLLEGTNAKTK